MTAQPLPPGHIRAAFAPIVRPAYCACDPAADPHRHVVHVDTYAAITEGEAEIASGAPLMTLDAALTFTDRTDATDAEFEARMERLDRLEVADEGNVERLARYIWESGAHKRAPWDETSELRREEHRKRAVLVLASLKPVQVTP